jgi:predicted metal-dependent HD superfamily phosphohydrolase
MGKQEMEQQVNWNHQVARIDLDSRLFMDCDMEIEFLQGKKSS